MKKQEREYLKEHDTLKICLVRDGDSQNNFTEIEVQIVRVIGKGSTCVTYEGTYRPAGRDYPVLIIIKELYPEMSGIKRDSDQSLNFGSISACGEFNQRKQQFSDNIEAYRRVDRVPELKSTIPDLIGVGYGKNDNLYHIFKAYKGKTLADVCREKISINEQLVIIKRLAEMLKLWCDMGYMLLDLSPFNILYLQNSQDLQFIDFDSLLVKRGNHWEKEVSGYRYNALYLPEVLHQAFKRDGEELDWKLINRHLNENTCHFYLGVQLYSMLRSVLPKKRKISEKDIDTQICNLAKQYPSLAIAEGWEDIQCLIRTLLLKLLSPDLGRGYSSLDDVISDLDCTLGLLRKAMDPQIIQQRYEILACNLIEEFPTYKYLSSVNNNPQTSYRWNDIKYENVDKSLEVLITGNHPIRKAVIKYLISCLQMDHVRISIHLCSYDVRTFWNELADAWPLISSVCKVTFFSGSGSEMLSLKLNPTLVDRELAEIYLYPLNDKKVISKRCINKNIRYILLLDDDQANRETLHAISSCDEETERFVAFLCRNRMPERTIYSENIHLLPISEEYAADALDTELSKKRIYKRGFFVHASYALGNNPYADRGKIREDYENNPYYRSGSIRSALHAAYKLVSVGIDPESKDAAWEYSRKVLDHNEILLDQMALEHRSWTAFMIVSGAVHPNGIRGIDEYAFIGGLDWKNNTNKKHMIHPCVAASSNKRSLTEKIWDDFDQKESIDEAEAFLNSIQCDALDRISLSIHFILKSRRKEYKKDVEKCLTNMQEGNLYRASIELRNMIDELINLWATLNDAEDINEDIKKWEEALKSVREKIGENKQYQEYLDNLEKYVKPFTTSLPLRHDFKSSDEDIVRAVPRLFLRTDTVFGKPIGRFSVMRYLSGNKWIDLQAALQTEPDKLILLADYQNDKPDLYEYKRDCQELLNSCGIATEVEVQDRETVHNMPKKAHVFFDLTGPDGSFIEPGFLTAGGKYVHKILFNGNIFVSLDSNHFAEILQRRPALSVKEWLYLHDCTVFETGRGEQGRILKVKDSIILWNVMRMLSKESIGSNETAWDIFMDMLEKRRMHRDYVFNLTSSPGTHQYSADVRTWTMQRTGLKKVLKYLDSKKIIECLSFDTDDEELEENVTFETSYKDLGDSILKICSNITDFCKVSSFLNDGVLHIQYYSRQVEIPETELTPQERQLFDDLKNQALPKKILKIDPPRDGNRIITLRSNIIFETLISREELFRTVIYAECVRKRVFDTVVTNTGFTRNGFEHTAQIIGIKDNCLYPIIITNCIDDSKLRMRAIDMMEGLSGTVIYFIDSSNEVHKKQDSRYYCFTPDDVYSYHDGACMLGISDVIRGLIKKRK